MPDASLTPPFRFALLAASIRPSDPPASLYRGALPKHHNLAFLASLGLKTIVSVTPKPVDVYEAEALVKLAGKDKGKQKEATDGAAPTKRRRPSEVSFSDWATHERIRVIHVKVGSGKPKDGHIPFDTTTVKTVLELIVSRDNLPMYIHDLDGSDVLSIMGAALRKLQGWSEQAYAAEMSRFLRAPPPAPEHRTFLSRLFASTPHASDDGALFLHIPPPSLRAPWLWSSGVPTAPVKKGPNNAPTVGAGERDGPTHASMRCRIARDPDDDAAWTGATGMGGIARNSDERSHARPEHARMESDGHRTLRGDSAGRPGSSTPHERDSRSRNSSLGGPGGLDEDDSADERTLQDGDEARDLEGEDDEDEEDEDEEDDDVPSRMIDALDLGI